MGDSEIFRFLFLGRAEASASPFCVTIRYVNCNRSLIVFREKSVVVINLIMDALHLFTVSDATSYSSSDRYFPVVFFEA